jgi:transcriptional regulator with XRE-family HTH domain
MSTNNILINIKKIRELNHISRDEIAKKLNMGTSGYSKIERGEVEVTIRKFEQIALILGHSMSEIIEFDIAKLAEKTKAVFIKKNSIQDKRIKSIVENEYVLKYIQMLEKEIRSLKKIDTKQTSLQTIENNT